MWVQTPSTLDLTHLRDTSSLAGLMAPADKAKAAQWGLGESEACGCRPRAVCHGHSSAAVEPAEREN